MALKSLNRNVKTLQSMNKTNSTELETILLNFSKENNQNKNNELSSAITDTPIGELITVGSATHIYLLQTIQSMESIRLALKRVTDQTKSCITSGRTKPMELLERELKEYFNGTLKVFTTPIQMFGTAFQMQVWNELRNIPFGKQISYAQLADNVKTAGPKSTASAPVRAVGTANGANRMIIIVPCHRVINKNGKLGGFGCGIEIKKWLLDHENKKP